MEEHYATAMRRAELPHLVRLIAALQTLCARESAALLLNVATAGEILPELAPQLEARGVASVLAITLLDGDRIALSNKEFSLLRVLAAEPARVFTRGELLQAVWGWSDEFGSRALDAHICRLRRKLRQRGTGFIVNVWGVGYRLIDAVGTPTLV